MLPGVFIWYQIALMKILKYSSPILFILFIVTLLVPISAWAGPPFRTDDPEPVEYHHWEIYTFSQATHIKGDTAGVLPGLDMNYGLIPEAHFHVTTPFMFDKADGSDTQSGYGDTEIGMKCRLIKEEENGWRPQIAIYPAVDLPTGDKDKGFSTGREREFLPVWLQKSFGVWTTYGGGGYWINPGEGNKDYWFFGWTLVRKVNDKLRLGGEIFYLTADAVEGISSSGCNLGVTYDLTENHHLLFSAGRGIQHVATTNEFSYYVAYQLTF